MVYINGKAYRTIVDAAEDFGVSPKTVREWIRKKIIPKPPTVKWGVRVIQYFPPNYMKKAKKALDEYRG